MKKQNKAVCPGCSRHCAADVIRCKRGRAYFEKLREKEKEACSLRTEERCRKHGCKWKKLVEEGGAVRGLIATGKEIKKALCRGEITESQLKAALSEAEWAQLTELLGRLSADLKERKKNFGGQ